MTALYERLRESQLGTDRPQQLQALRQRLHHQVIEKLGAKLGEATLDDPALNLQVRQMLQSALREETTPLSAGDRSELIQAVLDDVFGHGPIQCYLSDPTVDEVMVNGPSEIYVERKGKLERVDGRFLDESHLRRVIERIVGEVGRRIDESSPMVDARLSDGSRVNAIYPPLSFSGPYLTIRKFSPDPFTVEDLISFNTLTPQAAKFLHACVVGQLNLVISGGTGSGKTTLLNVLSSFIPASERIVTIEDAKELRLRQEHVLSLEARPPNTEGRGEITIRDLVRNALRMRPDRIIVGECRSGEALDMLQAMNTGHDGSITTVHANSPRDALARIETMTLMAGFDLPIRAIRDQMASALDVMVHLSRMRDGSRRVTHVTAIEHMEGDVVVMEDVYVLARGSAGPVLTATGLRPRLCEKLADHGIELPAALFAPTGQAPTKVVPR